MSARALLSELRGLGVALRVVDAHLHYRPMSAVTPELREQMAACKDELIALVSAPESSPDLGDGDRPIAERCPSCGERDFVRPRAGGAWRCARCRRYELPSAEVEWWPRVVAEASLASGMHDASSSAPDASNSPARACRSCMCTSFWRLKPAGDWTCSRCHPPIPAACVIETVDLEAVRP